MKYWILILLPGFLLITAPDTYAHNVMTVNGSVQDHQHVYRRQQYGKPLQQGHLYQSSGGGGLITWGSGSRSDYGKSTVRRTGPIIDDQRTGSARISHKGSKNRSAVNSYGKPVRGYGKSIWDYGKPVEKK